MSQNHPTDPHPGASPPLRPDFQALINRSPAVVFLWRVADGWPVEFVSENIRQFGYSPADFLSGRISWPGITHPDDVPRLEAEIRQYFRGNTDQFNQAYRLFDQAGQVRWIEDHNIFIRNPERVITHIQGIIFDVTARRHAEQQWQSRIRFERLIAQLSTRFINLDFDQVDQGINSALAEIGQYAGVDRSYICEFRANNTLATCTHEWCAPGIPPAADQIQQVPVELFPWLTAQQLRGEIVHIPRVQDLPPEAAPEKSALTSLSIQSMITVPLLFSGRVLGVLGFDAVRSEKSWTHETMDLLRIVGQMLVNVLQYKRAHEALHHVHRELEARVQERTAALAEANQSLRMEIAERTRAEQELHRRRQEFVTLVENAPDIIERFDRHFRILYVNPAIEPPTGIPPHRMINRTKREIGMPIALCDRWESALQQVFTTRREAALEFDFPTPRGQRDYHARFVPEFSADGSVESVLCIIRDTTEQKRAEEQLRHAKQAAEAANKAKDRFLAILSHELRAPLTPVLLSANAMETDPTLPQHVRQECTLIRSNIEMEARLIDDLLDLNRIVHGKLQLQPRITDIHLKLQNALELCRSDLQAKRLSAAIHLPAPDHHVLGDPGRLQQIFWNLIKNAVKFTPPGGRVELATTNPQPGRLRLEVRDDGIGIEPHILPHIFNAFEQGDPAITRQFGGLGLGLTICKALVELHNGSIHAHSLGKGSGTTFTIDLPTCTATASSHAQVPVDTPAPDRRSPTSRAKHPLRILLVDDHELTLRTLARILAAQGYSIRTASNVAAAKALADQEPFDLLISDLGLPDSTGYELMEYVKARHQLPGICLSGFGMEQDILRSQQAGFTEHLTKPVDLNHLLAAIDQATHPT